VIDILGISMNQTHRNVFSLTKQVFQTCKSDDLPGFTTTLQHHLVLFVTVEAAKGMGSLSNGRAT